MDQIIIETVLLALLLFCYQKLNSIRKELKHRKRAMAVVEFCAKTDNGFDSQSDSDNSNGNDNGQGGRNRDNIRELRKHQRSMKRKYHENNEDLRFYCFYKGITNKYYQTLRQS